MVGGRAMGAIQYGALPAIACTAQPSDQPQHRRSAAIGDELRVLAASDEPVGDAVRREQDRWRGVSLSKANPRRRGRLHHAAGHAIQRAAPRRKPPFRGFPGDTQAAAGCTTAMDVREDQLLRCSWFSPVRPAARRLPAAARVIDEPLWRIDAR
jgi:hypothetical protein